LKLERWGSPSGLLCSFRALYGAASLAPGPAPRRTAAFLLAALDGNPKPCDIWGMTLTVEESVAAFKTSSEAAILEYRKDPAKAREALIRSGIAWVHPTSDKLELVPQLQPKPDSE